MSKLEYRLCFVMMRHILYPNFDKNPSHQMKIESPFDNHTVIYTHNLRSTQYMYMYLVCIYIYILMV